ncbi:serine/threonine-protein kinase [Nonomuraea jabiensis]|uniref:serine/threonine-protein kinase n=1 Tax=Nonomuraea jabiensis TaxID=882448 RepID=UPI0036775C4C
MPVFESLRPEDPRRVGPYRIEARLGAGGMGRVFLGRSKSGRAVAVKVVHPELAADRDFGHRFAREISLARTVSGFFTAGVVDADPEGTPPWLATAYVPGLSLDEAVAEHGTWREEAVLALGAGLAEALESIHAAGVVHRDLKPSNVLLAADGPRVIDFGISVAVEGSRLTLTGVSVGTPGFISPEQLTGDSVGPASDVFCLGAVLAYAARGTGPFGGGSWQGLWYRTVHEEPDLEGLPPRLRSIVRRCLEKRPEERPSATALLDELSDGATGGGALAELYTEARWLPEPVAEAVRTLVAESAPPPEQPDDPAPSSPPADAPAAVEPRAGAPAAVESSADAPAGASTVVEPPSRTSTKVGRAGLSAHEQETRLSPAGRREVAAPQAPAKAPGSRRLRDRVMVGLFVSPFVALTIITLSPGSPEMPDFPDLSDSEFTARPTPSESGRSSRSIDYCGLLTPSQVRQLVPRPRERYDDKTGGCAWTSPGRALDVTPLGPDQAAARAWHPRTSAARQEFLRRQEIAPDASSGIEWRRDDIGVDRVFRDSATAPRDVPGIGEEAFASDVGPRGGGVHYTKLTFLQDNLVIEVKYTAVDAKVSDRGIRAGAARAAEWVESALEGEGA